MPQDMTPQIALENLVKAAGTIKADLQTHQVLQRAGQVLAQFIEAAKATTTPEKKAKVKKAATVADSQ